MRWQIKEQDPDKVEQLAQSFKLDRLLAKCLLNRNVPRFQDVDFFLDPETYQWPDPFLIPDMDKAIDRIIEAIEKNERICIYGDYDADGVCAIAILTQAIGALGGDTFFYIPDRYFEGAGVNTERLRLLQEEDGVGLVITVDTGIRAFEEMSFAREIDLDVIITDHHTPDTLHPDALAVLNPKIQGSNYPFDGLCGAGVALKIVQALDLCFPGTLDMERFLELAAIGTIADMVPLREENRWIVAKGLKAIDREEKGPIRGLIRKLGIRGEVSALDISYKVAPRINAPGRLGDPDTAISFFRCENPEEINTIIETMDGMNTIRQMIEKDLEAKLEIQLKDSYRKGPPPFILVAGRHWHRGVLGIMACKILRRYSRPACVLSFDSKNAHGSIRATAGLNLLDALHQISSLLTSFGGHPEAAGVTLQVTNVPQFKARMTELLAPMVNGHGNGQTYVDAVINWHDLNNELFESLAKMAPFGIGNAVPIFLSANLILESELMRKGPWFHFEASDGNVSHKCSFYHPDSLSPHFERFDSVDLVYSITPFRDEFQLQILEMIPSQNS